MNAIAYFKRMFEIIFLITTGALVTDERVRIERGGKKQLRLTAGKCE